MGCPVVYIHYSEDPTANDGKKCYGSNRTPTCCTLLVASVSNRRCNGKGVKVKWYSGYQPQDVWQIINHCCDKILMIMDPTGNDATPHIVYDAMCRLSCEGLERIIMCLHLLRILFGVTVRGHAQLAHHILVIMCILSISIIRWYLVCLYSYIT